MKKKRLAINLIANTISYSTTILVTFFLTPYLIHTLGKEVYSFYPLANNFVNYMSILTVALNSMASRFVSIELYKNNKRRANNYFVSVLLSNIILSFFLLVIMSIIVLNLESIINIPVDIVFTIKLLFTLVFLSMIVNIVTSIFGVAVFAKNRIDLQSIVEIIQGILRVVLYLIFFSLFKPTIVYVGVVALILSICKFIFHYIFTKKLLPDMRISRTYFDILAVKEILSSGIWNSVNQLGTVLLSSLSLLVCNIYLGVDDAGDYSIIQTVPYFISGVISMLTGVFMPEIIKKYAEGNEQLLVKEIHNSQKIIATLSNIPIIIFLVIGREFFSLWVPLEDATKLQMLSIMTMIPMIITAAVWPVSNLCVVINRVKVPSLFMIGCGLANIALCLFLFKTTKLGIYAITFSSLLINVLRLGVFTPIYPCKKLGLKLTTFYPCLVRVIVCSCVNFILFHFMNRMISVHSWITLVVYSLICSFTGFITSILIMLDSNEKLMIFLKGMRFLKGINKSGR